MFDRKRGIGRERKSRDLAGRGYGFGGGDVFSICGCSRFLVFRGKLQFAVFLHSIYISVYIHTCQFIPAKTPRCEVIQSLRNKNPLLS